MNNIEYLTIQERIELLKKNMAFSPSDAARKIISLAETTMTELIDDDKFLEKKNYRRYSRHPGVMYREFAENLSSVVSKELSKKDKSPYESRFGNNFSDYIYIAALSLASLPARVERYCDCKPQIYYNLRMTLGNYLNALIDISCDSENGKPNIRRANKYRKLKKEFSMLIDLSTPLCEAISYFLNQYSISHSELDRMRHIQSCKSDLDAHIQLDNMLEEYRDYEEYMDEEEDEDGDYWSDEDEEYETPDGNAEDEDSMTDEAIAPVAFVTDDEFGDDYAEDYDDDDPEYLEIKADRMLLEYNPNAYYLMQARKLPDNSAQSPEFLFDMGYDNPFLLADFDYSPEGFKARIDSADFPANFREIANEMITADGIASAFKSMDAVIDRLYRLLIEPFVEIGNYRFERHLVSDAETA